MKKEDRNRWAVLIGIPLWLLIALPMFSAMVTAYGRDSPMLILGAGAIALIGFALGTIGNRILK